MHCMTRLLKSQRSKKNQTTGVSGRYFSQWRERRGLTQTDVARRAGVTRVSITYWENFADLPYIFVAKMDRAYGADWREEAEQEGDTNASALLLKLIAKVEALDRDVRRALD